LPSWCLFISVAWYICPPKAELSGVELFRSLSILELSCLLKTASQVCLSSVIEEPLYLKAFLSSQNSNDLVWFNYNHSGKWKFYIYRYQNNGPVVVRVPFSIINLRSWKEAAGTYGEDTKSVAKVIETIITYLFSIEHM